jgi:hypothetical protein
MAGLGVALLSGGVFASTTITSAAICRPLAGSTYAFVNAGIGILNTGSSDIYVSCTVPMDNTALGNPVNFTVYAKDNSASDFSCIGYVYDQNGGLVATGTTMSATGTGAKTLTGTASVVGNVNTNVYAIQCALPGSNSQIYTVKAY